jgi:hypothetical protein
VIICVVRSSTIIQPRPRMAARTGIVRARPFLLKLWQPVPERTQGYGGFPLISEIRERTDLSHSANGDVPAVSLAAHNTQQSPCGFPRTFNPTKAQWDASPNSYWRCLASVSVFLTDLPVTLTRDGQAECCVAG